MQVLIIGLLLCLGMGTSALSAPIGLFPTQLYDNTTGKADTYFVGPPDDVFWGLGGTQVTYDFGLNRVVNGPGRISMFMR
jgi:hypothetical protein